MSGSANVPRHIDVPERLRTSDQWRQAHRYQGHEPIQRRLTPYHSVLEALAHVAAKQPDALLLTEMNGDTIGAAVTYGGMMRMVARRSRALDLAGLPRGSRVGLRPRNSIDDLANILAVQWHGSAAVLANPYDASRRVAAQFDRLGAVDLVDLCPDLSRLEARVAAGDLDRELQDGPRTRSADLAVVVFTSGSTGLSRAVGQSHAAIAVNVTATARHHRLDATTSLFTSLPIFHVNALEFVCFGAMISGSRVSLAASFDPFTYLPAVARSGAHVASAVPSLLQAVAADARRSQRPEQLLYVVSAAAPLTAATARAFGNAVQVPVVQGYGLSEAANFSCLMPVRLPEDAYRRLVSHAEITAVGSAVWGNDVAVLDPEGRRLPLGEVGEVGIRGHNVMLGYLEDPEATATAFAGGWLRTGDLARLVADPALKTPVLQITGRVKHMVKVRGHTVGYEEVERVLADVPGISAVAATRADHPIEGEVLCLLVVVYDDAVDASAVRAELIDRMGADYRPHAVHRVRSLPLLPNGKLNRPAISALSSKLVEAERLGPAQS
jgi:acyl-CoA synthetase (AMP-forming)/AMP-acid ligase II